MLSAVYPTVAEQYMVELYNWARANPAAAATKYGVALNEGPTAFTISTDPKQPLAINPNLTDSARNYAQYLIDTDQFSHTADGHDPGTRMINAGYTFVNPSTWGENAGLSSLIGFGDAPTVEFIAQGYYTDQSVPGRYHRIAMLNGDYKEIGSGIAEGDFTGFNVMINVDDFATSTGNSFLTGVAYTDSSSNNLYTPGEQMSGVTVLAIRNSDNAQFSTTTWASGGYTLQLPAGSYTVWGHGGTLGGWVKYDNVTISTQNVKRDFRPDFVNSSTGPDSNPPSNPPSSFATKTGSVLSIQGTSGNDTFTLSVASGILSIVRNGETATFTASTIGSISLSAGDGSDTVTVGAGVIACTLMGGNGNDTIYGSGGSDKIYGNDGDDYLQGYNGNDRIYGGNGNDAIYGGSHNDILYGEAGNDSLYGQNQNDYLDGGVGADFITGGRDVDTVDYSSRTAALTITLSTRYDLPTGTSGQAGENDNVLNDVENINGGSGNDRLIGSSSANVIHGNGGNDTIYGMAGADLLYGEDGVDRFYTSDSTRDTVNGGAGRDILYGDAIDLVSLVEVR